MKNEIPPTIIKKPLQKRKKNVTNRGPNQVINLKNKNTNGK